MLNSPLWPLVAVLCAAGIAAQWWLTGRKHGREMVAMRARHHEAQAATAEMLRAARQQNERIQGELADIRKTIKPAAATKQVAPPAVADVAARDKLNKLLDAAPARKAPVDGFADTMPSRQFVDNSSFDLLQRASTFAGANRS